MVRSAMVRSPRGHTVSIGGGFITIPRVKLDALLFEAAVRSGATPMTGVTVTGPLLDQNACVGVVGRAHDGSTVSIRSRYVVLACGSAPKLLATFGVLTRAMHSAVAVRGYLHEDPFPELAGSEPPLLIAYDRDLLPGYGWSFPLPDGLWNVGCGVVESLRRNPTYATVKDGRTALSLALQHEQSLIIPVRYLAGSFNYQTPTGAEVGDRMMSLVATARASAWLRAELGAASVGGGFMTLKKKTLKELPIPKK
jgi:flavin-dependent dehydrogenase